MPARRLLAAAAVAVAGAAALAYLAAEREQLRSGEQRRLAGLARTVDANLVQLLAAARAALEAQSAALRALPPGPGGAVVPPPALAARLQELVAVMPGVRTISWIDSTGRVVASNRADAVGLDLSSFGHIRSAMASTGARDMVVAVPYRTPLGVFTTTLAMAVRDDAGRLLGVTTVVLDPAYFETVLRSVLYADDMWAWVAHGDGRVLIFSPVEAGEPGLDLAVPGTLFNRHRASGAVHAEIEGPSPIDPAPRLAALRTVQPAHLAMDRPLVVALTRSSAAVLVPWRRQAALVGLLWLLLAAGSAAAVAVAERRSREAAQRSRERRVEAERLTLALAGAELALWDLDVPSQRCTVNDRWWQMLGEAPRPGPIGEQEWQLHVHPEDLQHVQALQLEHEQGRTPAFEAVYRMRHAQGHWIWVLDRARAVERDEQGQALRLVGTHMDISERVAAEQALRDSEQRLAITLHCIGDAVIATDPQGRITRLNATAERLTGWPAAQALGRPLAEVFHIFGARNRVPVADPVALVLERGQTVGLANDTVLRARDGTEYQIADSAAPIRDAEGAVVGVVLVFSDVTEQYRTVQALREREHELRALTEAIPGPLVRLDRRSRYRFANAAYRRWFGMGMPEIVGRSTHDVLGAEGDARVQRQLQRVLAGETVRYEATIDTAELGRRQALVELMPDRDAQGQVQGFFGAVTDLTDLRSAEMALRERERSSRELLEVLNSGVIVHAPDTRIVLANPAASRILRLSPEQLLGRDAIDPAWRFLEEAGTPMDPARFPVNQVIATRAPLKDFVVGLQLPGGEPPAWALCNAFPVLDTQGGLHEVVVTFSDITERQRAGQALRASEQRLRLATRLARVGGWRVPVSGGQPVAEAPILLSADLLGLLGLADAAPLRLAGGLREVAEPGRGQLQAQLVACAAQGEPIDLHIEFGRQGRMLHLHVIGEAERDEAGRIVALQGAVQDVSEQHRAQQELSATLAAVPDLLFDIDIEGVIHGQHSPRHELLYTEPGNFLGRRVQDLLPTEAVAVILAALQAAHAHGHSQGLQYELPLRDGPHWFELSVSRKPVAAGEVPRFIALARDISDRKHAEVRRRELEGQLRVAQKMESIGTLAGGIAHDFNNILAAILGNLALAREDLGPGHPALPSLEQVHKAGLRARSLVQQILAFSRSQPQQLQVQPLQPVLDETLALLRATLPASVRLQVAVAEPPLRVEADATQLQQVLMNLCTNAWHALPEGRGLVEVGLEALPPGSDRVPPLPVPAAQGVAHLWVRDDGKGMDEATRQRIFDPFFTTKPVGQGTGLGLAVVHGIVHAHHGAITVDSEPGRGSCFHLWFALAAPHAVAGDVPVAALPRGAGQGQQLLYVDDDEVLTLMVQQLLQRAGYRVQVCASAQQALEIVRGGTPPVELVVSDFNMPEMSGLDLAEALRTLRPGLPVIISSGYLTQELGERAERAGVRALMKKENTLEELTALVQRVLAAPRG